MPPAKDDLQARLQSPEGTPVWYFTSTQAALLREAEAPVLRALEEAHGEEATRIDGPAPDLGDVIGAAGAISLFGGTRVVHLREITPSAMADKDAAELAALLGELENAVLVVTVLYKDDKAAKTKKAKQFFDAAAAAGYAKDITPPTRRDNIRYIEDSAARLDTRFASGAAEALLERAGEDRPLLANETQKLAAIAGYDTITTDMVERYGAHNVEADVFALVRHIVGGNRGAAFALLRDLFALKHEPFAIAASLSGTFVDMLRVRVGEKQNKAPAAVFAEMGYKGNPWRLTKAKENARRYSDAALRRAVLLLADLDLSLRSTALPDRDKGVLVEAAVEALIELGARR